MRKPGTSFMVVTRTPCVSLNEWNSDSVAGALDDDGEAMSIDWRRLAQDDGLDIYLSFRRYMVTSVFNIFLRLRGLCGHMMILFAEGVILTGGWQAVEIARWGGIGLHIGLFHISSLRVG